ncbi:MAG: hypothetical protein K2M90_00500 [Treponemataceae bacterium]|nr:hypothetical protein [Treponemataceae bacterium]
MPIKKIYIQEEREITEQMERTQWEKAWVTRWHNLIDNLEKENAEKQEKIDNLKQKIKELKKEIKELSE